MAAYSGPPLTRGAVRSIVVDKVAGLEPVLQVLLIKQFPPPMWPLGGEGTYRIWLSDGESFAQACVWPDEEVLRLIRSGTVCQHAIVRIKSYTCRELMNTTMLEVTALEPLGAASGELGTPTRLELGAKAGRVPGAADMPLGFEEVLSPEQQRMCDELKQKCEANLASLPASWQRGFASGAAQSASGAHSGQDDEATLANLIRGLTQGDQRRGAELAKEAVQLLARTLANQALSQAERDAAMRAAMDAEQAAGRSPSALAEDAVALAVSLRMAAFKAQRNR